jgi:hypothetical protein
VIEILQPTPVADPGPDPEGIPEWAFYLSPQQMQDMLPLETEDRAAILHTLPLTARIDVSRAILELRRETMEERQFEEQVEVNRARKKAKHEADRRDAEERAAYLTSEEGRSAAAQQFEAEIIDLDDLEDPEPLIEGFLHRDTLVRTFGPPKSLKSFVTLDMAACVSLGIEWQGHQTVQTTVLYIVAEGARGVKKRRNAWNQHHDAEMKVIFYPKPVQIGDQEEMYRLIAFCLAKQVGYVVFDTQARCTVGVEENDNTEMGEIVAALDILKQETGACVHMVHHSVGSDGTKARGATAWDGAVDAEFYTRRSKKDPELVDFVTKFQKDIGEADELGLITVEVGASLVLDRRGGMDGGSGGSGEVAPALVSDPNMLYLETIRSFGNQAVSVTDVVNEFKDRHIDRSRSAIKKAFGTLAAAGAVDQTGTGTSVRITQAGLVRSDEYRRQQGNWDPRITIEEGVMEGVTRHPE